ncbi:hypothetical protein BT96DRAFT_943588 [Gymnopus androsaceus JB14]|uniref:C2H2-type domain-containing protein n=1 Tax=Gymnopus androsaceus JB14 TaxID=1447944 RepID=A0A6A4H820_9AGAR|nr:hypothetical protein BT96DRAFT_943588 [Gymnopus androsaceus JB14]
MSVLSRLYYQYDEIQHFLHETRFGLRRPLGMNEWYNVVELYTGPPEGFEAWLWDTLEIPQCILSIASYEPSAAQPNGHFACDYHGCRKEYKSKQARNNHFDVAHLGAQFPCTPSALELSSEGSNLESTLLTQFPKAFRTDSRF